MVKLFRCRICGDPYIGGAPPNRCPFCGAYENFIVEVRDYKETFDVELNEKDRANAQRALELEVFNSGFYFCAAEKTESEEGRQLFKALGKIEAEHASIWRRILKLPKEAIDKSDKCSTSEQENLKEAHGIESKAIDFYTQAANESENQRVRQIFNALVQVETDHLKLTGGKMR